MKRHPLAALVAGVVVMATTATWLEKAPSAASSSDVLWPTSGWAAGKPADVGLDEKVLESISADIDAGKYSLVDSFDVVRCGKLVYARKFAHDYAKTYGKEAVTRGPLNARLTGPYNYFDPVWHPYYHGTGLHSMQSVTKTVTSVIYGISINRGDFKSGLDTPILKYFDVSKVKNADDRKRRITVRHVLTMTTGLDWNESSVAYNDPRSDSSLMEATDDWVQYVIDKPMAVEPGKVFNYSSGNTEVLAYIFKKETGQDIEAYGKKYLFNPLGISYFWKRTPLGVTDTEGGLYLSGEDLAKIGYLYLHDGRWSSNQLVSRQWVTESVKPAVDADGGMKYGFKWWLYPRKDVNQLVWFALGFGGQRLAVFPQEQLIVAFTGWEVLGTAIRAGDVVSRILPAVRAPACGSADRARVR
jgi:CubicO group peptidase (beta-lactamase class C family)